MRQNRSDPTHLIYHFVAPLGGLSEKFVCPSVVHRGTGRRRLASWRLLCNCAGRTLVGLQW